MLSSEHFYVATVATTSVCIESSSYAGLKIADTGGFQESRVNKYQHMKLTLMYFLLFLKVNTLFSSRDTALCSAFIDPTSKCLRLLFIAL